MKGWFILIFGIFVAVLATWGQIRQQKKIEEKFKKINESIENI